MKALWGGRFSKDLDERFKAFNASLSFDQRLFAEELDASAAYAKGLHRAGILQNEEVLTLLDGIEQIRAELQSDDTFISEALVRGCEDIHTFVENRLGDLCGSVAAKIHTGRSRNEQAATNLRSFVKSRARSAQRHARSLIGALIDHGERYSEACVPGYTHLQRAQPLLWSHYIASYAGQINRDIARFDHVFIQADACPLGSGALAGNSFGIDRARLAADAGFSQITPNSLDATSDRDFVCDYLHAAALTMVHLSRMAEDFIIFATSEFGFLILGDEVTTGSSLMPQKKNPDSLELIRGKTGRTIGHLTGMLCVLKGLPSGYNKDLQEDKEALFDTVDTLEACLEVMTTVVRTMQPQVARMASAAASGYLNATELAEYLVRKGGSFRDAHEVVGRLVAAAEKQGKLLAELAIEDFQKASGLIGPDVYMALSTKEAIDSKAVPGGTAHPYVEQTFQALKADLGANLR